MTDHEIFKKLKDLKFQGIPACLATIVDTMGSTPREAGAKMIICADGTAFGTIGGGCGENEAKSRAPRCLLRSNNPELLEVRRMDALGIKGGDVCRGKMHIFLEPFGNI